MTAFVFHILHPYPFCNNLSKSECLKITCLLTQNFGFKKLEITITEMQSSCHLDCALSRGSRRESVSVSSFFWWWCEFLLLKLHHYNFQSQHLQVSLCFTFMWHFPLHVHLVDADNWGSHSHEKVVTLISCKITFTNCNDWDLDIFVYLFI